MTNAQWSSKLAAAVAQAEARVRAEYTALPELVEAEGFSRVTQWGKLHRGVSIQVKYWKSGRGFVWNYYIRLRKDQLPLEVLTQLDEKTGDVRSLVADLLPTEFHGGISYCRWEGDILVMGCDYDHLWDEGCRYSLAYVTREAMASVDSLLENVPELKVLSRATRKAVTQAEYDAEVAV